MVFGVHNRSLIKSLDHLIKSLDAEIYLVVMVEVAHYLSRSDVNVVGWCEDLVPMAMKGVEPLRGHPEGALLSLIEVD